MTNNINKETHNGKGNNCPDGGARSVILRAAEALSESSGDSVHDTPPSTLPSVEELRHIMDLVRRIIFPAYFDVSPADSTLLQYHIGVNIEELCASLRAQIRRALRFANRALSDAETDRLAEEATLSLIDDLPELRRLLYTDVEAVFLADPAVRSRGEIIFCYPVIQAMIHYRFAHAMLKLGVPVMPRIITELAHSLTGIDINPGATIGEYFAIDHGTGVVIGETCIIGNHVTLYQGVTLGAKNFKHDDEGHPVNVPRHPIIEDYVTIYSNASVLGRITIGHHAVIGGNIWVTNDIPPYSRVLQGEARKQ